MRIAIGVLHLDSLVLSENEDRLTGLSRLNALVLTSDF